MLLILTCRTTVNVAFFHRISLCSSMKHIPSFPILNRGASMIFLVQGPLGHRRVAATAAAALVALVARPARAAGRALTSTVTGTNTAARRKGRRTLMTASVASSTTSSPVRSRLGFVRSQPALQRTDPLEAILTCRFDSALSSVDSDHCSLIWARRGAGVSKAADKVGRATGRGAAGRRRRSLLEDLPEFVETMLGRDGMDDPDSMADARPPPPAAPREAALRTDSARPHATLQIPLRSIPAPATPATSQPARNLVLPNATGVERLRNAYPGPGLHMRESPCGPRRWGWVGGEGRGGGWGGGVVSGGRDGPAARGGGRGACGEGADGARRAAAARRRQGRGAGCDAGDPAAGRRRRRHRGARSMGHRLPGSRARGAGSTGRERRSAQPSTATEARPPAGRGAGGGGLRGLADARSLVRGQ